MTVVLVGEIAEGVTKGPERAVVECTAESNVRVDVGVMVK